MADALPMPRSYREVAAFMWRHSGPRLSLALLMAGLLSKATGDTSWVDGAIVLAMFLLRGFLEWPFHKYVWHSSPLPLVGWRLRNPVADMHARHHRDPFQSEGLIFGAPGVALACTLIFLMGSGLTGSPSLGVTFVIGFIVVLVTHEWHHVIAHSGIEPVSPLFRRAVRCHRWHHYADGQACMGVSSVLADRLLGTYHDPGDSELDDALRKRQ
jgi:sterol desaturase/sphingolipid hydroxylase (fatty acid hydroxylase superfamily)